jgi:hypothetical protein
MVVRAMKKVLFLLLALFLALGLGIVCANDPSSPLQASTPSGDVVTMTAATVSGTGLIEQVDPTTIPCEILADFEDVKGGGRSGTNYGTNYDDILVSGGLQLAERFSGQTLSYTKIGAYIFDVLSGTPSDPLALQIGNSTDNLCVYSTTLTKRYTNVVAGLGPLHYPDFNAIAEGSVAVLFPSPQSRFTFDIIGAEGGSATFNFFRADGTLLDSIIITPTAFYGETYGFRHTDGIREIAGFSIHNNDPAGIIYDNICYASDQIEVTKDYHHTNVCFEQDNDGDGNFSEDPVDLNSDGNPIDNDGDGLFNEDDVDCPDGTYPGDPLPRDAEGNYTLEAVVKKNGKVSSYNPGQYYAVSTVNVLADVDGLTIEDDFCECAIGELSPRQGGGSVVIVQVGPEDPDEVAYQILDAHSEEVTVGNCNVTVELADVKAGTTILMYVKFAPTLRGETWAGPYYCENTNTAWVSIRKGDIAREEASATLKLIYKE